MGMFDWLTGNRNADPSVPRQGRDDLERALLAAAPTDAPWHVRRGGEDEAELVAEWKIADAQWTEVFGNAGMKRTFRVLMRLDDASSTVRSVDQDVTVSWEAGLPRVAFAANGFRGQKIEVGGSLEFGRKPDGSAGVVDRHRFSTNDIKDPLRKIVAAAGWGWHGVAFAKL